MINTGEYGLQRLDYVVQSAEAHGVSLIINFVNNWTGMQEISDYPLDMHPEYGIID